MSKWTDFRNKLIKKILTAVGWYDCLPYAEEEEQAGSVAAESDLFLASCWDGANASRRMMNMLSPKFSDDKFKEYADWMTARGCNTVHLILANEGDGEGAGYWAHDYPSQSRKRISYFKVRGFKIVVWLVTDDSKNYLKKIFADPQKYVNAVADAGLLADASLVVLGLEMDEGGSRAQWQALRDALRTRYAGPIGTHHTSGNYPFVDLGEYVLDQLDPKVATEDSVNKSVKNLLARGKRVIGFEYARSPNRKLAQAAIDAGAKGAGNWDGEPATSSKTEQVVKENLTTEESSAVSKVETADETDFSQLDFCWGDFNGRKAKLGKGRIQNLKIGANLAYGVAVSWWQDLGASSKTDYEHSLACLFCCINGKWQGGKFDWISESRTTRSFENIESGYNGWDKQAVEKADKFAFVIVSLDGKRRTNVICAERKK